MPATSSTAVRVLDRLSRQATPASIAVSRDLRTDASPFVRRRRTAAGLALTAVGSLTVVALYQFGLIRHLPDPPLPGFDSDRVDASGEAYQPGATPDSTLAIASYGVTLALIGMGPANRWRTAPVLPLLAAAKAGADAAGGLVLTAEQLSQHRAVCGWCITASAASVGTFALTLPEAASAWRARRAATPVSRC